MYKTIVNIGFILGPVVGFVPQIYRRRPSYGPELSILTISSTLLKLFSQKTNSFDSILQYQFCVAILVHLYLIRLHGQQKGQNMALFGLVDSHERHYRHMVPLAGLFIISLKLLDSFGWGYLFISVSVVMDLAIAFLHIRMYSNQKSKPKELFTAWLIGDSIRLLMMLKKYSAPVELLIGTFIQIVINFALVFLL